MKEETTITFLAAECGEFHGMGECIECTSLKESLPALPEILQTFPSDASVFGIFPAPCRGSSV